MNTDKRQCLVFGDRLLEKYVLTDLDSQFKSLPLEQFYVAIARFSGPIACLYLKVEGKQYTLPNKYDSHLLIFNTQGKEAKQIPFDLKQRIVLFSFTSDETLLLMYATGQYYAIDTFSGYMKEGNYNETKDSRQKDKERFVGAELVNDNIVAIKERTIGVVRNFLGGQWQPLGLVKLSQDNHVFCTSTNKNNEILICYLSRDNFIECYNVATGGKRILFDRLLKQNKDNPRLLVSIGYQENTQECNLALIMEGRKVYFITITNDGKTALQSYSTDEAIERESTLNRSRSRYKYRNNYQLVWMDNIAVFVNKISMLLFEGKNKLEFKQQSKFVYIVQEVDGFRSFGASNSLYRLVSRNYACLVDPQWTRNLPDASPLEKKSLQLLSKLQQFHRRYLSKQVITISTINANGIEQVKQLLETILKDDCFSMDLLQQTQILKFVAFLKTYYQIKSLPIPELCADLRIVNSLRHEEEMSRWMSLRQFRQLRDTNKTKLIIMLLRYNMHFIADVIFGDSESKERIFFHWSKCKIEKESELTALEQIKSKYLELSKSLAITRVFTDLAKYCLDRGKLGSALRLIQLQQHTGRRIMVASLIIATKKDTQFIDKVIEFAQQCNQSSMIYLVIQRLRKLSMSWLPKESWVGLLHKKPILQVHYLNFLKKLGESEEIKEYLLQNKMLAQLGQILVSNQMLQNKYDIEGFKELVNKYKNFLPGLATNLKKCVQKKNVMRLRELKQKDGQITEEQTEEFYNDIDLEYLGQIILSKDSNSSLSGKVLKRIKSNRVYILLLRKGLFKEAIDVAYSRKDKEALLDIIEKSPQEMQSYGQQLLQDLKKDSRNK